MKKLLLLLLLFFLSAQSQALVGDVYFCNMTKYTYTSEDEFTNYELYNVIISQRATSAFGNEPECFRRDGWCACRPLDTLIFRLRVPHE